MPGLIDPLGPRLAQRDAPFVLKVFLVDDSAVARGMMHALLDASHGAVIVGEAHSAEDCFVPIDMLAPDVVVMDWSMPGMSGIEATAELRRTRPELRVVGFTSTDDPTVHEAFINAGATAVFAKEDALGVREYLLATAAVA